MNAPASLRQLDRQEAVERQSALTGVERLANFERWQRNLTDSRRDEMAALIVLRMDADMRLRVIRAAADGLSGYGGHDTIIDGVDAIQADLDVEDARQMGGRL